MLNEKGFSKLSNLKINEFGAMAIVVIVGILIFSKSLLVGNYFFDDKLNLEEAQKFVINFKNVFSYQQSFFLLILKFVQQFKRPDILMHLLGVFVHIANSFLLFRILKNRIKVESIFAILLSLIFLCHPVVVESVTWWSSARGTLSHFFVLLAIEAFYSRFGIAKYFLTALCIILSYYSKPVILSYLGVLVFLTAKDLTLEQFEEIIKKYYVALFALLYVTIWQICFQANLSINYFVIALVTLLIAAGVVYVVVYKNFFLKEKDIRTFSIMALFLVATLSYSYEEFKIKMNLMLLSIWHYLSKLFWDFNYYADYGIKKENIEILDTSAIPFVVLAMFLFMAFKIKGRAAYLLLLANLTAIFPYLGVTKTLFQSTSIVADRYSYLFLFTLILTIAHFSYLKKKQVYIFISTLILPFFIYKTVAQVNLWSKDVGGVEHLNNSITYNPAAFSSYIAIGNLYRDSGFYEQAYDTFRDGITVNPEVAELQKSFMKMATHVDKCKEAISYVEIIKYNGIPIRLPSVYKYIGICNFLEKQYEQAVRNFEQYPAYKDDFITKQLHAASVKEMRKGVTEVVNGKKFKRIYLDPETGEPMIPDELKKKGVKFSGFGDIFGVQKKPIEKQLQKNQKKIKKK